MRRRRVLVLNQFALPRSAPGGTRHVELFERLEDWETVILAGRRSLLDQSAVVDHGSLRTVPVTPYTGNGVSRVANWLSYTLMALLRGGVRRRLAVVYGSSPHLGAAAAGLIIARLHRAPFVLEVRDLWPRILLDAGMLTERSALYRALRRLELSLYRRADAIVVLAKGAGWELECDGVDLDKIHFLPNGADPSDFAVETDRAQLRQRHGLNGTVVVYAGAHGPANGLELVLDAAQALAGTNARFLLVGDGLAKADLMADARRRGLDNVEFRDPIPKQDIPDLLAAADIGLHCLADLPLFRHGVSPNKLYDYMAAGLPVVTNTPGEVAAMVDEAGAGEAVGPREIAAAVARMAGLEPEVLAKLGDNGRSWMTQHRSRTALADQLATLLDQVTTAGRPGR